jgi:hypothetical protein
MTQFSFAQFRATRTRCDDLGRCRQRRAPMTDRPSLSMNKAPVHGAFFTPAVPEENLVMGSAIPVERRGKLPTTTGPIGARPVHASRRRRRYAHDQLRAIPTPRAPGLNFRSR